MINSLDGQNFKSLFLSSKYIFKSISDFEDCLNTFFGFLAMENYYLEYNATVCLTDYVINGYSCEIYPPSHSVQIEDGEVAIISPPVISIWFGFKLNAIKLNFLFLKNYEYNELLDLIFYSMQDFIDFCNKN